MDHRKNNPAYWYYYNFGYLEPGRYYCGDSFQLLPAIQSGTADMVLIDPPYYMEKDKAWDCFDEGSKLEQEYYMAFIWPRELAGEIDHVERHVQFELLPKAEYCGISLPAAHYTPDFLIFYKSGTVEAVEVKHEAIRKNQRDYIYRRRLFIDNVARPNGWRFTEYIKREDKKQ